MAVETLTQFEFLVQGRGTDAVILKGFPVHIVQQRPPLKGTHVPPSGAGGIDKRHLIVHVKPRQLSPRAPATWTETIGTSR